ncbi:MAG: fasciclin domain-containing protein [Acidobacteria bacterium]|nr:fasciclin domain-containing protein [Acidobacteriota bacterium]
MKRTIISALLIIAAAVAAFAQESKSIPNPPMTKTVVETLRGAGNFNTFLSLLETAGLKNLGLAPAGFIGGIGPNRAATVGFSTEGYRTTFAPNDAAFAKLPKGALAAMRKDPKRLRSFLLGHMLLGKVMVKDMFEAGANSSKIFKSANGSELSLIWTAGINGMSSLQINGKARVGKFQDVMASDYLIVIHEIDAVLMGDGSV